MAMVGWFLLGSIAAYAVVTIIYRLHIHPLSRFPGPRLAALTGLYEIYFCAWGGGLFESEIERLHQEYGPIVRITPDEVHIQEQFYGDPDNWIKGPPTESRRQLEQPTQDYAMRKSSMSRVRSMLQVEIHHIIHRFVQRHSVDPILGLAIRPLSPTSGPSMVQLKALETDLEDGHCRTEF